MVLQAEQPFGPNSKTITLPCPCGCPPSFRRTRVSDLGDIYYNAVGSLGDEAGNRTGTGSGESFESKLEELSSISSVEACFEHCWVAGNQPSIRGGAVP